MKLRTVTVADYKSIRASRAFDVTDITCLVGKNEAGKTALLEALYRLNPVVKSDGQFDVTSDYPRADVEDYQNEIESKKRGHATVVEAIFVLEDDDLADVHATFGEGVIPAVQVGQSDTPVRSILLSKGYSNELEYELDVDEAVAVRALVQKAQLPIQIAAGAVTCTTLQQLADHLARNGDALAKQHAEMTARAFPVEKAALLEPPKASTEPYGAKRLRALLSDVLKVGLDTYIFDTFLEMRLPKFLYFDEFYQMEGAVNLENLRERQQTGQLMPADRPMLGLIELARLDIDQLIAPDCTQALLNKLEGASNHLSKQFLKYWSQNRHIQLRFDVRPALAHDPRGMTEGHNLWGMVHDSIHQVSTGLGARSRGFVWFFSFVAWYSQQKRAGGTLILLLDEPGLFLHASAQGDFLRYMEAELRQSNQVIYTTHSPFLVDPARFERVRIVEDQGMDTEAPLPPEKQGTKVFTDVLDVSDATLFPLKGALGYEIVQSLVSGSNCLIVESPADLLYLQAMSSVLERRRRTGLNPKWLITPVGGTHRAPAFAALIGAKPGMNLATLTNMGKAREQWTENLYRLKLMKRSNVHTFAEFTGTEEADLEDMFDRDFYVGLVNAAYSKSLTKRFDVRYLGNLGERIGPIIAAAFEAGAAGTVKFNRYRPARLFTEHLLKLEGRISEQTLARFEAAFKTLNGIVQA